MVKVLEPAFLKGVIGEDKKAAELAGYVTMMEETRKMLGPQKLMVANVLRARFPDSVSAAMKALDGSYIEGFEGAVGGMSKKDYVAKGIEAFQQAAGRGPSSPTLVDWATTSKMRMKPRGRRRDTANPGSRVRTPRTASTTSWRCS